MNGPKIADDPEIPCRVVRGDDSYLRLVCSKHQESCTLTLRRQRRSVPSGARRELFQVDCPRCGPLGTLAV
jgi:hypothetical protein